MDHPVNGAADDMPPKAASDDYLGRFREIVSEPLNQLIERAPSAGVVEDGLVALHNGIRVPLEGPESYYGTFSQILVINRGVHEPLEEYVFQELLKALPAAPVMLELGAYWGHYSMWLKLARPEASVHLVEPDARRLAAGRNNFALNGVEGEFIHDFVGRERFSVDAFLAARGLGRLDVLHADIQGYELEMLEGAQRSLASAAIDHVFISTHSQKLHRRGVQALRVAGYRVEVSSDFETDTTSSDGLIVASGPTVPPLFEDFSPLGREDICQASPAAILDYLQARG